VNSLRVLAIVIMILDALKFTDIRHLGRILPDQVASLFPGQLEEDTGGNIT
jgi:hypothetical protein